MSEDAMKAAIQQLSDQLSRIEGKVDRGFNGPEGQPERGLHVRVDRLERQFSGIAKIAWISITSAVGAVGAVIAKWININPPT
jgi:hypothetical protein